MGRAPKKKGSSITFIRPPVVVSWASMVGPMEGRGPYGAEFDWIMEDYLFGEPSWDRSESKMLRETIRIAGRKISLEDNDTEVIIAGDLLKQIAASNHAARDLNVPFLGIYGACSTLGEGSILGAMLIDGGYCHRTAVGAVSHHHTAEADFGLPSNISASALPTAQWTVTGAGCLMLCDTGLGPSMTTATIGRVVDSEQGDINDLGGAMAPATADTMIRHFQDLERMPEYYDLIITGDLGKIGASLVREICSSKGYNLHDRHVDCGVMIYDPAQDVQAGGRGCGCTAAMVCGPFLNQMAKGVASRILVVGTGALTGYSTGVPDETIPCIAHAVSIEKLHNKVVS
ncbi:MAG: stage V sporulation protein AD [Acidobacteriota bacterium]